MYRELLKIGWAEQGLVIAKSSGPYASNKASDLHSRFLRALDVRVPLSRCLEAGYKAWRGGDVEDAAKIRS